MDDGAIGILFDEASEGGRPCKIAPRGVGLDIWAGGTFVATWNYGHLSVSLAGTENRYISFSFERMGKRAAVFVEDRRIVQSIAAARAPQSMIDKLDALTKRRKKTIAFTWSVLGLLVASAAVVVGLFVVGMEWATARIVDLIPPEWETEIGRVSASSVLAEHAVCSDPGLNAAVGEIGARLAGGIGSAPYPFHVHVIENEEVNAFVLPGGYIFVNSGLVEKAETHDELAGVLAHEISHALLRHGLVNMVRQAGIAIALGALVGDVGQLQSFLTYNAAMLTTMSFSRKQEIRADEEGLKLVTRSRLDPQGLVRFLDKTAREEGSATRLLTFVSTHPDSLERAARLRETLSKTAGEKPVPLTSDARVFKNPCTPKKASDPDQSH